MLRKLAGNQPVKDHLIKLLREDRLPRSLIFSGPAGVGKRQFALQLAKGFVCGSLIEHQGCGECAACSRVQQLSIPESSERFRDNFKRVFFSDHPDVATVVPYNRAIFVDAVRDLEREAFFRPFEARARFFVIDEADKMNDAAANALLKTLEEPSETSYIALVTSRPDSLLPTIRSRCQIIRFAPVEMQEVREHLVSRSVFTGEDAKLAALLSGGSIGR
ncbi:MAG: DNA polymerase III subunit, partial [Blastocatellia bacterium]|nr:DNA polymerase III subunit [Blastocatellia bacterium]